MLSPANKAMVNAPTAYAQRLVSLLSGLFVSLIVLWGLIQIARPQPVPILAGEESSIYGPMPIADNSRTAAASPLVQEATDSSLLFVENIGQFEEQTRFQAQLLSGTLHFVEGGFWLTLSKVITDSERECNPDERDCEVDRKKRDPRPKDIEVANLKIEFQDSNQTERIGGFNRIELPVAYFLGASPEDWYTNVPVYSGIRYEEAYEGIDIEYVGDRQGNIQPRLVLKTPAANPDQVQLVIRGALRQERLPDGSILIETELGRVVLPPFEVIEAKPNGEGKLAAAVAAMMSVGSEDLIYSSFLGGGSSDEGEGIAIDSSGRAYVVGTTASSDFPSATGSLTYTANLDAFIVRFNAAGTALDYVAYLGGSRNDWAFDVALDESNNAYIVGTTESTNFPTTVGAYDTTHNGASTADEDAFVAKLNSSGTTLTYATYLGGSVDDVGRAIAIDGDNEVYVTGLTRSSNFPTSVGAYDTTHNGVQDVFVTKLNAAGSGLQYSTFIGHSSSEEAHAILLDDSERAYVAGSTSSSSFPVVSGGYDTTHNGSDDIFLLLLNSSGNGLTYGTFLGDTGSEFAYALARGSNGALYLTGETDSSTFPTTVGAYDTTYEGDDGSGDGNYGDMYVAKMSSDLGTLNYSTFIGGGGDDIGYGIAVDDSGNAYAVGNTTNGDQFQNLFFPVVPGSYDTTHNGSRDAFVLKLNSSGSSLAYSTYFGGDSNDYAWAAVVDEDSNVYFTGDTSSSFVPLPTTVGAYDTTYNSGGDAFAAKLNIPPAEVLLERMARSARPECPVCDSSNANGWVGGPINTRDGHLSYQTTDLAIPVRGGYLAFERSYASNAVEEYTQTLGLGWTHNFAMKLHFSGNALSDTIELQATGGSRLPFFDNGDGTYTPYAGVTAQLGYISPTYVITAFNQTIYRFDSAGLLTEQQDPFGNVITFTHDMNGRLTEARQNSRYLSYSYDGSDRLSSVSDNLNRTVVLEYDATSGDLISVTNPLSLTAAYAYSGTTHLLTKVTDPSGVVVEETAYDNQGRAVQQWDGMGNLLVEISYAIENNTVVTENGVVMTHTYDARGTLIDTVFGCADGTAGCGAGTDVSYDDNFNQSGVTDANGNSSSLSWDDGGSNLESVTDALGNQTAMGYDSLNNLTQTTDARGNSVQYGYHNTSLPTFRTHMTDTLDNVTIYTPTVAGVAGDTISGLLKAERDPNGLLTTYEYNDFGQMLETVRAAGSPDAITNTYGYDAIGRAISVTQVSALETIRSGNFYDAGDRLIGTISNWDGSTMLAGCSFSGGVRDSNICTLFGHDDAGRTVSTTNALGQTSLTFYDDAGRSYLSVNNYDGTAIGGNPVTSLCDFVNPDPENNICSLSEYDGFGRVVTSTDSIGRKTVMVYDALSRAERTIMNYQNGVYSSSQPDEDIVTQYGYDAVGNTIIVTDTLGRMTRTFFDALNRTAGSLANWDGSATLADCSTLPANRDENICTEYAYDEVGNTIIVTDTLGRMTRTFYDDLNRVEATVANWNPATLSDPSACVLSSNNETIENVCTLFGYDAAGNQITTTNALDQTSLTVYDSANRPFLTVQNWDGTTVIDEESDCSFPPTVSDVNLCSVTTFDTLGRQNQRKDPLGNLTDFSYDGLGRVVTTTRYLNGSPLTTVVGYDALGNQVSSTDPEGNVTSFGYDGLNRRVTTSSAEGVVITQSYNAASWIVTSTDSLGQQTIFDYDDLGRQASVTDGENHQTQYQYDGLGNQLAMVDAEGVKTSYQYDDLNRLSAVIENDTGGTQTNDSNVTTSYLYDALGNRVVITNALGFSSTQTLYDALNRPEQVTDALGHSSTTRYNALGNRTVMTDANGAVTEYGYDGLNRLTSVDYLSDTETVEHVYDALGNRVTMTDSLGVSTYSYDDLYRLITATNPVTGSVAYAYDLVGNRTALTYPDGKVVTYTYDMDNRLTAVYDWSGESTTYAYDAASRLITTTLPNGVTSVNQYDAANRLIGLTHTAADSELLASYTYTLDDVGNRVGAVEILLAPTITTTGGSGGSWSQVDKLTAADGVGGDLFGWSVALDDGTAAIGARLDDTAANKAGSAYIFTESGGSWSEQTEETASDAANLDQLGNGVAIDGNTLIAGAPTDDDNGADSGSAYIFTGSGSSWSQQAKLTPSDGAADDQFGYQVAISGDTAVVGAYLDDDNGADSGSVYIFTRTGITWTQQAKITATDGVAGDHFGYSVAIDGDTVVIGAKEADDTGSNEGAAYIFTRSGTTWSQQAKITASDASNNDRFGYSVAIDGDSVIVGAYQDDPSGSNSGSAYVFTRSGSSWSEQAKLTASDGGGGDQFGWAVTIDGDTAVVGSIYDDDNGSNAGAIYLFTRSGSSWMEEEKLTADDGAANDRLGVSVGLDGETAVAGAFGDDSSQGAAYLFATAGTTVTISGPQTTTISYDYDPLYRLTNAIYSGSITATFDYVYDAVGNMTAYTETIAASTSSVTRTFNAANQLINSKDPSDPFSTVDYTYDNNGNLLQIQEQILPVPDSVYIYDQRNLLIAVEKGNDPNPNLPVADYLYDGDGDRIQQVVYSGTTPITTTYVNDVVGLSQVLQSDDGTTQTNMLFGLDLILQDDGATTRTMLADGLGSVRTELVGTDIETITTYEPFGKLLVQVGTSGTVYGFTGEQYDAATALTYLRARYYNAELKIFTIRDPFPGWLLEPGSQHGYSYVGNNPINRVDPTGQCYPPIAFLREIEPTNCGNLDLAISISTHPNASFAQRAAANTYITAWGGSHIGLVVGTVGLTGAGASYIAQWGLTHVLAGTATGQVIAGGAIATGAGDELATLHAAVTGDPAAQQQAFLAQQMANADGGPYNPIGDAIGGARYFANRFNNFASNCRATFDNVLRGVERDGLPPIARVVEEYIDEIGGSIIQHPLNPEFYSVQNRSGGRIWISTTEIGQLDFGHIVDDAVANGENVQILSGVHGSPLGYRTRHEVFFKHDVDVYGGLSNVNVVDVNTISDAQFDQIVQEPGTIICAWCMSESDRKLIDVLRR